MKALKDCKWIVNIHHMRANKGKYSMDVYTRDDSLIKYLSVPKLFETMDELKGVWEKFANLNGITEWNYVE